MMKDFKEISSDRETRLLDASSMLLENPLSWTISEGYQLLLGKQPTLADVALVTEVDQLRMLKNNYEIESKWPKVFQWAERVKKDVSGYQETHEGLEKALQKVDKFRQEASSKTTKVQGVAIRVNYRKEYLFARSWIYLYVFLG